MKGYEKRFTIVNMGLGGQFIKDNGKIMIVEDVVELLNEQHEEIQQLKIECNNKTKWIAQLMNKSQGRV